MTFYCHHEGATATEGSAFSPPGARVPRGARRTRLLSPQRTAHASRVSAAPGARVSGLPRPPAPVARRALASRPDTEFIPTMSDQSHRWVVDSIEESVASLEVDGTDMLT